ncbi:MAG: alpha/beta fold hydrolase [Thalassobaculaceae bacterium]
MPFADLDDGKIFFERRGAGRPLFLIPPISRGPEGLDPFIDLLASDFQVLRHDQRGLGASPPAAGQSGPVPLARRAAEAFALLDHLGVDALHVVGHSTGCGIALEMWRAAPARIESLTLAAPWGHGDAQLATMQNLRVAAARALSPSDYATYNASLLFPPWYRQRFAAGFAAMAAAAVDHPQDATAIANGLIPILNFDGRAIAGTVTCPTQIIAARDDQLMPPWHGRAYADLIAGSQHVLLEGGGHMLLETCRDQVATLIREFVSAAA